MANEAVLFFETQVPIMMTVSNTVGIERGTVLKLTDPFTASLADGTADFVAGIAAGEKIASDGKTTLEVYREGIFKMTASGAINCGDAVATAANAPNYVMRANATASGSKVLGIALETAATTETFLVELKPEVLA